MPRINRTTQQDRDRKALAAIEKYLMKLASFLVVGVSYSPAEFAALLQKDIDLADAATQAKIDFFAAARASREHRATMLPILAGFRKFLGNMFTDASILAEFGFTTRNRSLPTAAVLAEAVKKRNATRKARHTMGPKQKAKITGAASAAPVTGPSLK